MWRRSEDLLWSGTIHRIKESLLRNLSSRSILSHKTIMSTNWMTEIKLFSNRDLKEVDLHKSQKIMILFSCQIKSSHKDHLLRFLSPTTLENSSEINIRRRQVMTINHYSKFSNQQFPIKIRLFLRYSTRILPLHCRDKESYQTLIVNMQRRWGLT